MKAVNEDGNKLHRGLCAYIVECCLCGQHVDYLAETILMPGLGDWIQMWHRRDCTVIAVEKGKVDQNAIQRCEHCINDR